MASNEFASRRFRAPGYAEGRGDVAPAGLNLSSIDDTAGNRGLGDSFASVASSQFPATPGARRRSSLLSKTSMASTTGARRQTKSIRPGRGTEHKERYFKDRTAITMELAKLAAAEDATWAPYAILRPALPETALFSYVKPKKRKNDAASTSGDPRPGEAGAEQASAAGSPVQFSSAGMRSSANWNAPGPTGNLNLNAGPRDASLVSSSGSHASLSGAGASNLKGLASPVKEKQDSFRLVDGKLVRSSEIKEAPPQAQDWELDPMANREGNFDLTLDDPKYIANPTWARCGCLRQLGLLADPGDTEVIAAAIKSLADTAPVVRLEALNLLKALSEKGSGSAVQAALPLTKDPDANVRAAACLTLQSVADPGVTPSRNHPATGTSLDVVNLKRDKSVIEALTPLLDDAFGHVRAAAAAALDKLNAGWQSFKLAEERWDDSRKSPRPRRPLESERVDGSRKPIESIWDRAYTYDDLLPDLNQKGGGGGAHAARKHSQSRHDQRYLTLAGYKYRSYNDALRQDRIVARFEAEQHKAASKLKLERQSKPATEGRKITTEWMGIEWADRSKRTHLGRTLHAFGAGVDAERDKVAAPYNDGYNGFAVPLGYSYI